MIDPRDVRFEAFSGGGPGGQYRNRHANCVRAIHEPTGVVAIATSERSMRQNKAEALSLLESRIVAKIKGWRADQKRKRRAEKPDAAYGHAIRVYRLCGKDQGVTDKRVHGEFPISVLKRGDLDGLMRKILYASK